MPAPPPVSSVPQPAPALLAEVPAPTPPPRPRQPRRDPPPGEGERQVHIMRVGDIDMPDGTRVGYGDRVNFPEEKARRLLELGIGNYVKFPDATEAEPALEAAS